LNAYPNAKGIRAAEGIINQHLAKNGVAPTGVSTNGQSQGGKLAQPGSEHEAVQCGGNGPACGSPQDFKDADQIRNSAERFVNATVPSGKPGEGQSVGAATKFEKREYGFYSADFALKGGGSVHKTSTLNVGEAGSNKLNVVISLSASNIRAYHTHVGGGGDTGYFQSQGDIQFGNANTAQVVSIAPDGQVKVFVPQQRGGGVNGTLYYLGRVRMPGSQ